MKWFLADAHIDHAKVLTGPRGNAFATLEEWQNHIISITNRLVCPRDTLFFLGDFAFKKPEQWVRKFQCKDKWLIIGNHDPSLTACELAFGKGRCRLTYETKLMGTPCFLSHYAHAFWPKSHHGSCHLYGHCHDLREQTLDQWMPKRRSMDCSPETAFRLFGELRPMNEEEIANILLSRPGHDEVSFYENARGQSRTE